MAKYKAYPEYKDSGVEWLGEVPSHWEILSAKRMFQSVRTPAYKSDEQLAASQKYGVIPQALMMQLNDSKVMLALKGTESFRHVEANNFVISLRSFEGGIEYSQYTGCVSPAYTVLKNAKPISYGYYRYLLKCMPFIAALQSSTDSLRDGKSINYEQFSVLSLPLSSVQEQNVIAAFLDHETAKIDNLIEKQQQLIELLKEKRQAVISHAVTKGLNPDVPMKDSGVEWLGDVPEHWIPARLKYHTRQIVDGAHFTPTYTEKGIPFLRVTDIQDKYIDFDNIKFIPEHEHKELIKRCRPENGDLLLSKNGTIGVPKLIDWGWEFSIFVSLCLIKFKGTLTPEYSEFCFKSHEIKEQILGLIKQSTVINLHLDKIQNFWFCIPPLEEQYKIVNYLNEKIDTLECLIESAELTIRLAQERRTALISAAVTGKIDVRDWAAPDTQDVEEPQEATV
ncbi:restriction endonuclease subunit S [Serratia sp. S1B]|nr:restriction endonuclease subunit S [Serratia sp. S1B]